MALGVEMNFDQAFEKLIGHEGGYVSAQQAKLNSDPGGETKYGISKRSYPDEDIANLTLERAKQIYQQDYWTPAGCDLLPDGVRFDVFDMAVNSGVRASVKMLQQCVGVNTDGIIGPKTLQAVRNMPPTQLSARLNGARLVFMTTLPNWLPNSRGWARRIASNLMSI